MLFKAGVITLSDKGARGERIDESGPLIKEILEAEGICQVLETVIIPDEPEMLKEQLIRMSDEKKYELVLTTGGTGLSPRDFTPEATIEIADRDVPGIAEYMRAKSFEITPKAMLSRGVSVMRGKTLIINLPGSPKAVKENLGFILPALGHGLEIMTGKAGECGTSVAKTEIAQVGNNCSSGKVVKEKGTIKAVCVSEKKGIPKTNIDRALVIENFGIKGDAHAGQWHRQVSLLAYEKIEEFKRAGAAVMDGSFGENLIIEGINLRTLPIGTRLRSGDVLLEVTQIGKECHSHCAIGEIMGTCIMPKEGIFAKVLTGGWLQIGDTIETEG